MQNKLIQIKVVHFQKCTCHNVKHIVCYAVSLKLLFSHTVILLALNSSAIYQSFFITSH